MTAAPLVLLHAADEGASTWSGLEWPPERRAIAAETPTVASVTALLESFGSPAVLVAHGDAARISTEIHAQRPELVVAEIVVEPDYAEPVDAETQQRIAARSRPTLGVFASEESAEIERVAGPADRVVWPGFSRDLHREAPAAFVRTVERWLARL